MAAARQGFGDDFLATYPLHSRYTTNNGFNESILETQVSHYENIEKHLARLPQFKDSAEFLDCLTHLNGNNVDLGDISRFESQFVGGEDTYKYEVIIENQRGATVLGMPLYSRESLLYPLDPPKFQTLKGHAITSLSLYPLPSRSWRWSWNNWFILMIQDVDQEGWVYSKVRFGSSKWKGIGRFGNFVRRRVWVRKRELVPGVDASLLHLPTTLVLDHEHAHNNSPELEHEVSHAIPEESTAGNIQSGLSVVVTADYDIQLDDLLLKLDSYKIDRLKVDQIIDFLFNADTQLLQYLIEDQDKSDSLHLLQRLAGKLEFNESKRAFLSKFHAKLETTNNEELVLIYKVYQNLLSDSFYGSQRRQLLSN
ncbi:hypothetical protein KL911_002210 [Ogataea haglerorum]|uniref:uncharacterized protein n=1 Tax=Ogataea haglerorum TaxID=1937702 RepID=UPI001C8AE4E1|nr:uncharacterized protein KL911_002210 [Ogataea haglerorum]KAG7748834.1 hypothetical protein KL912_001896 [Ogataea haglerorum]KAG7754771.1 hypothetical protein KL911_002210 [Ogataea haglerorum]